MAEEQKKDDSDVEVDISDKNSREKEDKVQAKGKPEDAQLNLEIEDDTPEDDRGRDPMPKHLVDELEADELEEYSDKVKTRLHQMKKVWHDERREKERVLRENQEALALAQKIMEENRRLKATLSNGEKTYMDTAKNAAELELDNAKRIYKEAFDSGDSDQIVAAQEKLSEANHKMLRIKEYRPSLQEKEVEVQNDPVQQVPRPDQKTIAWQERNKWFGTDEEMTALALGFHQKLEKQYGRQYVGTDEYWGKVDETMRRRFPDYFGEPEQTTSGNGKPATRTETKPANVVAPASRSTSSKKIVLKQSQITLATKLGLTPEQYAKEYAKTMGN